MKCQGGARPAKRPREIFETSMALEDDDQQSTQTLKLARPYYSYITEADRRAADEALAKFVYSSNSPLGLLENKHFKEFVHILQQAYTDCIPKRHLLSNTLLTSVG